MRICENCYKRHWRAKINPTTGLQVKHKNGNKVFICIFCGHAQEEEHLFVPPKERIKANILYIDLEISKSVYYNYGAKVPSKYLRTGTPAGRVDLEGTRRDTDRFGLRSTEHTVTAGFAPPPLQGAQLAFSATWNQLRAGPTRVRALSGLVSLMTAPATWLRVQAGVEAYDWRQSGLEDQRFLSGRVGADATVGQLELSLAAEAHRREFVVTNLTRRVTLRVLRRF